MVLDDGKSRFEHHTLGDVLLSGHRCR
jgi:hypothetical protein